MVTAADTLIDALRARGVEVVFGSSGEAAAGLIEAFRRREGELRFVQARDEESAALMACGYARFTGKLGVCLTGCSAEELGRLDGFRDARSSSLPVLAVAVCGDEDFSFVLGEPAACVERVLDVRSAAASAETACAAACSYGGVALLVLPLGFAEAPAPLPQLRAPKRVPARRVRLPDFRLLASAAEAVNAGKRVAILAGRQAGGCARELELLSERLAAPIVKTPEGKATLADSNVATTGCLGSLGTQSSRDAVVACDVLLSVGGALEEEGVADELVACRAIRVNVGGSRPAGTAEFSALGDVRPSLQALLPMLRRKLDLSFLQGLQVDTLRWWSFVEAVGTCQESPLKPEVVAWELGKRLDDDAIVICGSGEASVWSRFIVARDEQIHASGSSRGGLPLALSAQLAFPKRQVVAFVDEAGDGLFEDLAACVKLKLPIKIVVVKRPRGGVPPVDLSVFAGACGAAGLRIDDAGVCGYALTRMLEGRGPALLEAVVEAALAPRSLARRPRRSGSQPRRTAPLAGAAQSGAFARAGELV